MRPVSQSETGHTSSVVRNLPSVTDQQRSRCATTPGGTQMYSKDGENYFIVDSHIALWDGRPENQRNIHGKQFIDCFYDYHRNLSPESEVWPYEDYLYQGGER